MPAAAGAPFTSRGSFPGAFCFFPGVPGLRDEGAGLPLAAACVLPVPFSGLAPPCALPAGPGAAFPAAAKVSPEAPGFVAPGWAADGLLLSFAAFPASLPALLPGFPACCLSACEGIPSDSVPCPAAANALRILRATGGSTVDEADLTNSPISLSLFKTSLLPMPSSLAKSYTRALGTHISYLWPRARWHGLYDTGCRFPSHRATISFYLNFLAL